MLAPLMLRAMMPLMPDAAAMLLMPLLLAILLDYAAPARLYFLLL